MKCTEHKEDGNSSLTDDDLVLGPPQSKQPRYETTLETDSTSCTVSDVNIQGR